MRKLRAWDEAFTKDETLSIVSNLASVHANRVGGKAAGVLKRLIASRDFSALCNHKVDYTLINHGQYDYGQMRQALAYFTKLEFLEIGIDKQDAAWSTFLASEKMCRETNTIFRLWASGDFRFSPTVEAQLFCARRRIAQVLGDVPRFSTLGTRFGPGATSGIIKRKACSKRKFSDVPTCSSEFATTAAELLQEMPGYTDLHTSSYIIDLESGETKQLVNLQIVEGRISFVPKSPKTYRTIGVEPFLNGIAQLAYGDFISDKLRSVGVDLHDQSRNKRLAREGSLLGHLATLDLSSASDTISRELVFHLLPLDWAIALDRCRTGRMLSPSGEKLTLEKFSSMGNGFTFPLESLIFWALATSVQPQSDAATVSVYGDDIVVDVGVVDLVKDLLVACGFSVNLEKSYWSGPFRESCGGDYFLGIDIRPVYVKSTLTGQDLFRLHNHYMRIFDFEMAAMVRGFISEDLIIWGPDGFGDGHLISDRPSLAHNRDRGWGGFIFDTYTYKGRRDFTPLPGDGILPTYSIYCKEAVPCLSPGASLRETALEFTQGEDASGPTPHKRGVPGDSLPGTKGYKRISIYTLTP